MEKLFTKYFWIINIVFISTVAFFLASGAGELFASKVEELLPKADTSKKPVKITTKKEKISNSTPPNGDIVLSRNIFDSISGAISRVSPEEETLSESSESEINTDELPIVPCTMGGVKLVSTVASSSNFDWSFATVDSGNNNIRMYRMGDELNGRKVSGVTWRYLFLRGNSDECYLDMFPDPNAPPPSPSQNTKNEQPVAASSQSGDNRIQKISEGEAIVERSLVNELLANPTSFVKSVRVRPHREGGKVVGYRLRQFQPNSPIAALGAQKGDIIKAVNGVDLTSMDKALGAYQSMRNVSDMTFSVIRGGKPMDLKVSIR